MIIAANFKTNHTRSSTEAYVRSVESFVEGEGITDEVMVFPPASALTVSNRLTIGCQNAFPIEKGSMTGEIGTEQLDEFGIKTVLIGHSERRHKLYESEDLIKAKFDFFSRKGYRIVFCIGEPLEINEQGLEAVIGYNRNQLEGIDTGYANLVVAYEPVWAIGTGVSATTDAIANTHNVGGLLIGTASWKPQTFCDILAVSKNLQNSQ